MATGVGGDGAGVRAKFSGESLGRRGARCACCSEPLYGRLCWNPSCSESVHDELRVPVGDREVIVTSGEVAR
jgi:hypothetical protein